MSKAKRAVTVTNDEKDFAAILNIITEHRSRALMSVNVESLLTYWEIGAFLSPRIHSGSWSTAVVGKLADYIKRNQPELRGYGKSNLYNMALVYDSFSSDAFLAVLDKYSAQLRNYNIFFQPAVGKSDVAQNQGGPDVSVVVKNALQGLAHSDDFFQPAVGKSIPRLLFSLSFVKLLLIAAHGKDCQELLFYIVYAIRERLTKEQLRQCLSHDAYSSLLGGDKKNYSKKLKELYPTSPVVIKDRAFLDYLALPEKHKESIGIILCREANRVVVEYAMSRAMSPVMVAQYKRVLIPKEVLERTFQEYLSLEDTP